jgi:hypothetical protein
MSNVIDSVEVLAMLACKAQAQWGVWCSWVPYDPGYSRLPSHDAWESHITSCLPINWHGGQESRMLPPECSFLHFFEDENQARAYYKECRGEDHGIYNGVYASLIRPNGEIATTNT